VLRAVIAANPLVVDALIALGLTALSVLALVGGARDIGLPHPIIVTLLLMQTVPLVVRRRFPVAVLLVTLGATVGHVILAEGPQVRTSLGAFVAVFTVAERLDRRTSIGLAALTAVALAVFFVQRTLPSVPLQSLLQTELGVAVAWFLGNWSRIRHVYTEALHDRARLLERERAEEARRAIQEERRRIARELHDVVTHHVSVIVIQAGAALRWVGRRPDDVRSALEAIDATGRQALTDMRRMLGILGSDGASAPQPGLDRLGDLVEQVRAAGLVVELSVRGTPRSLDPGLEMSAYRIIQEGLTNSLKHAGGRARVTVEYGPTALEISIDDERGEDMPEPVEPAHEGRGLLGMRERVALFRGHFAAQPTPLGFRVTAKLPLDDSAFVS
jgi:signal transduction histidine kinase